jgi:predicted nucleic acid-binding protein
MPPILIDTNLLVYLYDQNAPAKQEQAIQLLERLELAGSGRLSVQCLAEFFSVAVRKLHPPLKPAEAYQQIEKLSQAFIVLDLTAPIVLEAARGVRDHQLAYYDAQIWATARLNQIPLVLSEDFSGGAMLEGVRFVNPFAEGFALEAWV